MAMTLQDILTQGKAMVPDMTNPQLNFHAQPFTPQVLPQGAFAPPGQPPALTMDAMVAQQTARMASDPGMQTGAQTTLPNPDGSFGPQAAGGGPAPMLSTATGLPPGQATFQAGQQMLNSAQDGAQLDQAAYLGAITDEQNASTQMSQGQADLNQVAADKGEAMQGIDAERETNADTFAKRRQDLMDKFDKENAIQEQRMKQAVQNADQASIHDFWQDKSVGARILGMVAQALSGAASGLAGNPGAPTPLDRLINDDLQRQMANQKNKEAVAGQQTNMYRIMLDATGNRLDAETALQQAANNRVTAMALSLADRMAVPEAKAKAKMIEADNQQKNAILQEKRIEARQRIASQDAANGLTGMAAGEGLAARADATAAKGAGKSDSYYALPGTLDEMPKNKTTPAIYGKQYAAADSVTKYLSTVQDAMEALDGPGGIEAFYQFSDAHDLSFAQGRSDAMLGLGKKLEGSEETMANHMAPGYIKTFLGQDVTNAKAALISLQNAWGRTLMRSYQTAHPGVRLDYNAPVIGPIFARLAQRDAQTAQRHSSTLGVPNAPR